MTIESEVFYSLMQNYRHAPVTNQDQVVLAYQTVLDFIHEYSAQRYYDGLLLGESYDN